MKKLPFLFVVISLFLAACTGDQSHNPAMFSLAVENVQQEIETRVPAQELTPEGIAEPLLTATLQPMPEEALNRWKRNRKILMRCKKLLLLSIFAPCLGRKF